jgi:hypothetical protein
MAFLLTEMLVVDGRCRGLMSALYSFGLLPQGYFPKMEDYLGNRVFSGVLFLGKGEI